MASVRIRHGILGTTSDAGLHAPVLSAINDTSNESASSVKRLITFGYTEEEAKRMTGFKGDYAKVFKFNPYHDSKGRFSSKDAAGASDSGPRPSKSVNTPKEQFKLISEFLQSIPPRPPRGKGVKQDGVKTIDDLYRDATKGQEEFTGILEEVKKGPPPASMMMINSVADYNAVIDNFQKGSKGPVVILAALKGRDRLTQKVTDEYKGDPSLVGDVVRGTVAVDSIYDIDGVLDNLKSAGVVLAREPKNRFDKPTDSGYRDLMMNIRLPSGHIAELQVNTKAMFLAKDKGHKLYERERVLEVSIKDGTASKKEQSEYLKLQKAQKKLYGEAWAASSGPVTKGDSILSAYYIYDGMIPAKVTTIKIDGGVAVMKYLYIGGGEWKWLNNPEAWDMNAVKATKKEFNALVAEYDKTK